MSFSKNISHCRRKVATIPVSASRQFNSGGSNSIDTTKMQAKSVVLSQWKLINHLKTYIAKFSNDKTFENALNKEFAQFLQKIQPKTYGNDLVRYFETITSTQTKPDIPIKNQDNSSVSSVFDSFKFKIGATEETETVPKWKIKKPIVSKESIASRTGQVLASIIRAESEKSKLARIEDLNAHLKQYPEAKHNAVKEGAIRILLRVRQNTDNIDILSVLNESFALLGYVDPVPGTGVRILSIDGGGVRGILVVEMLRKLEELSGKPIYEMFDIICGVSTGAILATLAGLRRKSLDEVTDIYKTLSTQIFTQSAFKGTSNLVWSQSYYDTELWEKLLQSQWDDKTLIETSRDLKVPKFCAVSAVVNQSRLSAYVFRNYSLPCRVQSQYLGDCNHKVWEAVRASAAAPTYFEEFKLGNMLHQDGGILVNNPTAVAIHEAKLLWPETPVQCVVSFGTGRTAPNPIDASAEPVPVANTSWKSKFFAILDSATDTEGVHTMLSDLLPPNVYYRFNPYLTEMLDIAEINPNKLEQLKRDAVMYLRRNEDKFVEASKVLNVTKGPTKKAMDWLNLQKEIHGIKSV